MKLGRIPSWGNSSQHANGVSLANANLNPAIIPNVGHQGVVHRLAKLLAPMVVQALILRVRAGAEVIDRRLEVVVPVAPHELTPNSHQGGTYVELSIFGVRTLSYLIGQPRYGLVFCDVVLHTFFCGLSLDSIS